MRCLKRCLKTSVMSNFETLKEESAFGIVSDFFQKFIFLLRKPKLFFDQEFDHISLSWALAFALIVHWLGSALGHLSTFSIAPLIPVESVDSMMRTPWFSRGVNALENWLASTAAVVLDPFGAIVTLLLMTAIMLTVARIFGLTTNFKTVLKIKCLAFAPTILSVVPIFGSMLASILTLGFTIIGMQSVFKINSSRAMVISLSPYLLIMGLILMFIFGLLLIALFLGFIFFR